MNKDIDYYFDTILKVFNKTIASDIVSIQDIKFPKNEKPLFHFVEGKEEKRNYLEINDDDLELLLKHKLIKNKKSELNKLYEKFETEDGSIYFKNKYGDRWKLLEDKTLKRVAWGF